MQWMSGAGPAGCRDDQGDLESWLAGHRERVEARGEQVALHPVLAEFLELIDTDAVVRMYIEQMIAQEPSASRTRSGIWRASSSCCA